MAVGTAVSNDFNKDKSSYTLYRLRKDGARNECDFRVFIDEHHRKQPITLEKRSCDMQDIDILGTPHSVHRSDVPRYNPFVL